MSLLAIAYPVLNVADLDDIQHFRSQYDERWFNIVAPHFTLIFPLTGLSPIEFVAEVEGKLVGVPSIEFTLPAAIVHKDELTDYSYCFLVPSAAPDEIAALHHRLHSGILFDYTLGKPSYMTHITIGNSKNEDFCRQMCREWNNRKLPVSGRISAVQAISFTDGAIELLKEFKLS